MIHLDTLIKAVEKEMNEIERPAKKKQKTLREFK